MEGRCFGFRFAAVLFGLPGLTLVLWVLWKTGAVTISRRGSLVAFALGLSGSTRRTAGEDQGRTGLLDLDLRVGEVLTLAGSNNHGFGITVVYSACCCFLNTLCCRAQDVQYSGRGGMCQVQPTGTRGEVVVSFSGNPLKA